MVLELAVQELLCVQLVVVDVALSRGHANCFDVLELGAQIVVVVVICVGCCRVLELLLNCCIQSVDLIVLGLGLY